MRYIATEDLKPGAILAKTLYGADGRILIRANTALTPFLIARIHSIGFAGTHIFDPGEQESALKMALDEATRIRAAAHLQNLDIDKCIYIANEITSQVLARKDIAAEVNRVSCYDLTTWLHSVDVCTYSVMLGAALGWSDKDLIQLSQAALLHDIGKCMVNLDVLNKPARLTPDEFGLIKNHPTDGWSILRHNTDLSAPVCAAVYEHHENEDGSGYPRGIKSDKIHRYAKVIHITDVYEACTAKRPYKKPMNPADALENLMAGCGRQFDEGFLTAFCMITVLYPVGCTVLLSDGTTATVVENRKNFLARPLLKSGDGFIDLMERLNVTIISIV